MSVMNQNQKYGPNLPNNRVVSFGFDQHAIGVPKPQTQEDVKKQSSSLSEQNDSNS